MPRIHIFTVHCITSLRRQPRLSIPIATPPMSTQFDPQVILSYFENTTGLVVTFLTIIVGCYFFVYLPKQYEIKEKDHRRMGGEQSQQGQGNSAEGLKNAAVGAGVEKVPSPSFPLDVETRSSSISLNATQTASIMSPPSNDLAPPSSAPITLQKLAENDGTDPSKPIWLAIKGTVFDVSGKKEMYGKGGSYHIFAGKDGSVGLGESCLSPSHLPCLEYHVT